MLLLQLKRTVCGGYCRSPLLLAGEFAGLLAEFISLRKIGVLVFDYCALSQWILQRHRRKITEWILRR